MFLLPKSVHYRCPICALDFKERKILEGAMMLPSCPRCNMAVGEHDQVFPRRVRVRCPSPLCKTIQVVAVHVQTCSSGASCRVCGTALDARRDAFPRLPVRIVKRVLRAVGGGIQTSWKFSRFLVRSSWKAGVFAVCSPFRAARAVALFPFHAAAAVGRWAFNLPFAVLERYLRARLDYRALDLAQIVATLKEPKAPVVVLPTPRFVPQTFPASPCALDHLTPGTATEIDTRNGHFIGKVIRHQIFFDEELFEGNRDGEREFFITRNGKSDAQSRFEGDQMLVMYPYVVLAKRIWAEVTPRSNLPPETAARFLEETAIEVEIQCCREVAGVLSHFYRREIKCEGLAIPGDRCFRVLVRPPWALLQAGESISVRFIVDGVVLQEMGRVQR